MTPIAFRSIGSGLLALILSVPAFAEIGDFDDQSVEVAEHHPHPVVDGLSREAVGVIPQVGVLVFTNSVGDTNARALTGATFDFNAFRSFDTPQGGVFFGPSVGLFYSHLGTDTSGFFGFNSQDGDNAGTHLLLFPFNAKAGFTFLGGIRPSVHAGATLIYNNSIGSLAATQINNSSTNLYPDAGVDLEWQVGRIGLAVRPDWVFTSNTAIFSGTFGVLIPFS